MNESDYENYDNKNYKCGKLSEVVITSLRSFFDKIKIRGLKRTIQLFLPAVDLDEFVLLKIKNQMQKRRAIELKKGLGRIDIQYRRGGIQIEPAGLLRLFIKRITITDSQIIRSFNDIVSQIESQYIHDDNYIITKIDEIIFELSQTGIYTPKNSEEKTLYDFAMLIVANYYKNTNEIPDWISQALGALKKGKFIEDWIECLTEYSSEIIAQVSENIFFDFKFTFDSFLVRSFLNQKTNKGQLSQMIKMFDIDIKAIIHKFAQSYVSPSFLRGARIIISDIACGFLSDVSDNEDNVGGDKNSDKDIPEGIFNLTVSLSGSGNCGRTFRWYSKNKLQCKLEYSQDASFSTKSFGIVEIEKVKRTFPNLNLSLISSYHVEQLYEYSAVVEGIEPGDFYYRIVYNGGIGQTYKLKINAVSDKNKFLIFADSQGMVKSDYDRFLSLLEGAVKRERDIDFLVHLGDFVDDGNNEDYWKWVLDSDVWRQNAALGLSGNHEARQNIVAYNAGIGNSVINHFNLPISKKQDKSLGAYYAVVYGDITIIVLNTNTGGEYALDEKQYKWAIDTAKNAKTKWKILFTHKSSYSNGPHHKDQDVKLIGRQIDDIAYYGKIDVVFGGHDHVYARTPLLAQRCKVTEKKQELLHENNKYEGYINPLGTVFVVPGTSGVKNYKQHFPAGFAAERLLNLNLPVYSSVTTDGDNLFFSAYTFDEASNSFCEIDSFAISKSSRDDDIFTSDYVDDLIAAIPDVPWKNHSESIDNIEKIYSKMDYNEKLKLKNYSVFNQLIRINDDYKSITNSRITVVKTLKEFLSAIDDETIGTIITDCSEINFEKGLFVTRRIRINRALCIDGNAKLLHVRFVVENGACVMIKGSVCVDNTRKPYSIYPAIDAFEMLDNTILILSENASINNGYGIGKHGYGINAVGESALIYLNSSGHNFARKGMISAKNSTVKVTVTSGKYISRSRKYTFDINGDINISGGFVRSVMVGENGTLVLDGGTIGDNQRKSLVFPIESYGKTKICSGVVNSHAGVSLKLNEGAEIVIDKKADNTVDIKGKILYNQ